MKNVGEIGRHRAPKASVIAARTRFASLALLLVLGICGAGCGLLLPAPTVARPPTPATLSIFRSPGVTISALQRFQTIVIDQVATWTPMTTRAPTAATIAKPQPTSTPVPTSTPTDRPTATTTASATSTATLTPTPSPEPTVPAWVSLEDQCEAVTAAVCDEIAGLSMAPRYHLDISISLEPELTIQGTERVLYTNRGRSPLSAIYFRLYPNASTYGGSLVVNGVRVKGEPSASTLSTADTVLQVPLVEPLRPGDSASIEIEFVTTVPRDSSVHYQVFNYSGGMAALANCYPTLAVHDEDGWDTDLILGQGDALYCEASFYRASIRADSELVLVASGSVINEEKHPDGTSTWTMVTGPIRDFGLAASMSYRVDERQEGEITVRSFYLPDDAAGGAKMLDYAVEALRIYSARFGPYPYTEFEVAETPIDAGGMEFPGMTMIQDGHYHRDDGYDEFVVAHEVAHQWWYDQVGNDQQEDPWVDEGLTNYSAIIYFEDRYQRNEDERSLSWYLSQPYQRVVDSELDLPSNLPVDAYETPIYYRIVYAKAGLFYHSLRERLGDAAFFRLLRQYLAVNRWGIVTGQDVLDFWTNHAGTDIGDLVQRWILGPPG